ncbi:hypothetical protein FPV67DRAFT_1114035 [Lyophyllum atratum]|nr:hypothetical protein FPV67DRAFT_1114035 [Lyophyllum atratum]
MPSDIPADVAYIGGVWCEGVLYGIHVIVFGVVCSIFLGKSYRRGREIASASLLALSTCMFILSTAHVALALHQLLQGFIFQRNLEGGPEAFFHHNIFPSRKAIYIINTLLGDSLLIWRVYIIWGRSWKICALPALLLLGTTICGIKTIVTNATSSGHSVFTSDILSWVTSTFVLNIATQVTATFLLASRIYNASNLSGTGSRNGPYFQSLMWVVVESGAIYTSAALVQLVTYLLTMNAGVILELMLAQLSAIAPALIVVRVGLGFAYEGNELPPEEIVLTTFHDTVPMSIESEKSISDTLRSDALAEKASSEGRCSHSTRFRGQSSGHHHHRCLADSGVLA